MTTTMEDLSYEIEQLWIEGMDSTEIAEALECPVAVVQQWIFNENLGEVDHAD